jgi:hypothetical protein
VAAAHACCGCWSMRQLYSTPEIRCAWQYSATYRRGCKNVESAPECCETILHVCGAVLLRLSPCSAPCSLQHSATHAVPHSAATSATASQLTEGNTHVTCCVLYKDSGHLLHFRNIVFTTPITAPAGFYHNFCYSLQLPLCCRLPSC